MEHEDVKTMMEFAKAHAYNRDGHATSNRAGNPKFAWCAMRRRLHSARGLSWHNRSDLEREWATEWDLKSPEQKEPFLRCLDEARKLNALDELDGIINSGTSQETGHQDEYKPPSSLLARIGNAEFPVDPQLVEDVLNENRALHRGRGGVQRLAASFRSSRRMFVDNPGPQQDGLFEKRCVDKHPGFCPNVHSEEKAKSVREMASFLHGFSVKYLKRKNTPEPVIQLNTVDAETGDEEAEAAGLYIFCGSREKETVSVWARCKWQDVDEETAANGERESFHGKLCVIEVRTDPVNNQIQSLDGLTSWRLATLMAGTRWRCRVFTCTAVETAEISVHGYHRRDLARCMKVVNVAEDLALDVRITELLRRRREVTTFRAAAVADENPFIGDLASLAEIETHKRHRPEQSTIVAKKAKAGQATGAGKKAKDDPDVDATTASGGIAPRTFTAASDSHSDDDHSSDPGGDDVLLGDPIARR